MRLPYHVNVRRIPLCNCALNKMEHLQEYPPKSTFKQKLAGPLSEITKQNRARLKPLLSLFHEYRYWSILSTLTSGIVMVAPIVDV